jgi:hypothetical protein
MPKNLATDLELCRKETTGRPHHEKVILPSEVWNQSAKALEETLRGDARSRHIPRAGTFVPAVGDSAEKRWWRPHQTQGSKSCKDYLGPTVERGANVRTLLKVDAALKGAACARRRKQQWLIHTSNLEWNMTASSFRFKNEQRERMTKLLSISFKDAITAVDRMEHPLQIILEAVGNVIRTESVMQATL